MSRMSLGSATNAILVECYKHNAVDNDYMDLHDVDQEDEDVEDYHPVSRGFLEMVNEASRANNMGVRRKPS